MQRGFENILDAYLYNMVKGVRNIVMATNNIKKTVEQIASDAIDDIDERLNKSGHDAFLDDEEEEEEPEDNILVNYCFGPIMGSNYGARTLLEYEEECNEGTTCADDIDPVDRNSEKDNLRFNGRGNRPIK